MTFNFQEDRQKAVKEARWGTLRDSILGLICLVVGAQLIHYVMKPDMVRSSSYVPHPNHLSVSAPLCNIHHSSNPGLAFIVVGAQTIPDLTPEELAREREAKKQKRDERLVVRTVAKTGQEEQNATKPVVDSPKPPS